MKKKATAAKKTRKTTAKKPTAVQQRIALAKLLAGAKNRAIRAQSKAKPRKVKKTTARRTLSLNDRNVITWKDRLLKLGRNAPYDAAAKPRLELDKYLAADPPVPAVVDFASEVLTWPMYGNDNIGDCTAACAGHQIQAWTRYTGAEVDVPQDDIIQLYSAVSGYDPQTGANDNGATVQDVLAYWRKSGVPVAGHKILAFAQLKDLSRVKDALWVFGSVYLGINCPQSALDQFDADQPWSLVPGSPIAGGHAVPLQLATDGSMRGLPPYQVVTWGRLQGMTQDFLDTYVEEAWVVITDDWLDKNGHTPEGLDLAQLGADLAALTGDPNPFPAPPAPPAPAPVPPEPAPVPVPPAPQPDIKADLEQLKAEFDKTVQDAEKVL